MATKVDAITVTAKTFYSIGPWSIDSELHGIVAGPGIDDVTKLLPDLACDIFFSTLGQLRLG